MSGGGLPQGLQNEIQAQLGQGGRAQYGQGGLWNTSARGVASPQAGRPPLTGGLQQMEMLRAFQSGASMNQLQMMNPYSPRPTQFLPPRIAPYSWANDPMNPANQRPRNTTTTTTTSGGLQNIGGPGGGPTDGGPGANGLDGGSTVGPGSATGDGPSGIGSGDGVGAGSGSGGK
jgi:hypothetical protein